MDAHFVLQGGVMAQFASCVKVYILIEKIKLRPKGLKLFLSRV